MSALLLDTHAFIWFVENDDTLVAQAITHSLSLVSRDAILDAYPIERLWK